MPPVFLILLLFYLPLQNLNACSCVLNYFCEAVEDYSPVAIKVKAIEHILYEEEDLEEDIFFYGGLMATYLEVIEVYKDDIQITDTIKVYGSENSAGCDMNVHYQFPIGEIVIANFTGWDPTYFTNPDAAIETYREVFPNICSTHVLRIEDNMVVGNIADGIEAYPLKKFAAALSNCSFSKNNLSNICAPERFSFYPNPSTTPVVNIEYIGGSEIKGIRVYGINGALKQAYEFTEPYEFYNFKVSELDLGVNIIEVIMSHRSCTQKILVTEKY